MPWENFLSDKGDKVSLFEAVRSGGTKVRCLHEEPF